MAAAPRLQLVRSTRADAGHDSRASERVLIRAVRRGSRDAASQLFARHWSSTWRAALAITGSRADADDAAQDAFVRAFASIDGFDDARPFAPWVHRIAVNRALDLKRRDRRLVLLPDSDEIVRGDSRDAIGNGELLEALQALDPDRRAAVVMRYLLGYTPPEIADSLNEPVGTINSRLARGLAHLRDLLGGEGD